MGIRDFFAGHRCGRGEPGGWMLRRVGRKLDLDAAQRQRLAGVQGRMQELRSGMQTARDEQREALQALFAGEQFDREEALRLFQVSATVATDSAPALVAACGDFYDTLDAQQRARLRELIASRRGGACRRH